MTKDEKIKSTLECLQVSLERLRKLSKDKPEMALAHVEVRGWLFASQIHLENLEELLKDLQPSLF